MEYLLIFISAIFVNNIVLSQFLGICPFLGVSKKVETAKGMGLAVTFVLVIATIVTYLLQVWVLNPFGLQYLQTIVFILVIAALVQMVEIVLKKLSPSLYQALGVFLPLITTNCCILGVAILVANGTYMSVQPAMEGKYINLTNLENINTSKHYWTQGYNDMVTFTDENMQFLASGPIAISMFRFMYLTLYNKTLFTDNQIPDLYETVKAGKWTLDYQYSIVKDHYVDKDGDSKASEGDFYGFVTGDTISVDPYMVASDIHMITKDAETGDLMYNAEALGNLSDLCDKVQLLYNDASTYVYKGATMDDVPYNYIIEHFTADNALMVTTMFLKMETNFESLAALSYGIAPMPKFSEMQKSYYSYVQDQVTCFGISAVVGDTER